MRRGLAPVNVAAVLLLIGFVTASLFAQEKQKSTAPPLPLGKSKTESMPPGGPPPKDTDGHVDLSGVWFPGTGGGFTFIGKVRKQYDAKAEEPPPFQPWAAAKIKAMSGTDYELGRASVNCLPRGVPGMFLIDPYPFQIIQKPGLFAQLDELNNNWRVVHTDGRKHDPDPDPSFDGDEVGHWEGGTLVIDVIAIDERTWNNFTGWFHSDQEHVVEHISRPSLNYLQYQVTIEDPKVLTKPWNSVPRVWTLGHEDLLEYYCTNNQDVDQYKQLKEKEDGGK